MLQLDVVVLAGLAKQSLSDMAVSIVRLVDIDANDLGEVFHLAVCCDALDRNFLPAGLLLSSRLRSFNVVDFLGRDPLRL